MVDKIIEICVALVCALLILALPIFQLFHVAAVGTEVWLPAATGLAGIVLGSLISGGVSWAIERSKQRDLQLAQYRISTAKLQAIISDFINVREQWFLASITAQRERGILVPSLNWMNLQPFVPAFKGIDFDAAAVAAFLATRESALASQLGELARQHSTFAEALQQYNSLRMEMRNVLISFPIVPTDVSGQFGSLLTEEQRNQLMPREAELSSLIKQLWMYVCDYISSSHLAIGALQEAGQRRFGKRYGIRLVFDERIAAQNKQH